MLKFLDGLRRILCQVGLQSGPQGGSSSLVDQLMLNDSKMWKGRHKLLQFWNLLHSDLSNSVINLLPQERETSTISC